ncbi:hypothetical protein [Mucilaginibacter sp.]|uniref:hypothetical protein n=1 Tax=Mucilaginibacter sp. TaxID=1882438 RepID=UPI00263187A3|nr:hypothetical protein [Mucilaginibacter sp.]MDB4923934.1 hypothetical protein [Mucilaginibacter sp.]
MNEIKEGQIWSYKCRKSEAGSRVTIIKVDDFNNGPIVHIKIEGLKLIEKASGEITATSIEHLPISLEMFKKSVCKVESIVKPTINEGYLHWEKLFNNGKAGAWAVEIANAIELTEETYNL